MKYNQANKEEFVQNKIIEYINCGYTKHDATMSALEWWDTVSNYDEENDEIDDENDNEHSR
jgi:hypothetical protein